MKIAVVGATGLVGRNILEVLEQRNFPITELIPVASARSAGKKIAFKGNEYVVCTPEQAIEKAPQIAIFSAGGDTSGKYAPEFAKIGCYVVDNSSYWRMDPTKKLVIPEINADVIEKDDYIIANPNCSTIQMLIAIADLHKQLNIKRIVVNTYQSITGTGKEAVDQMGQERELATKESTYPDNPVLKGSADSKAYLYQIDLNLLPQIDKFLESGYTKEEMKMVNETHKIMGSESIRVSPTTIRVPVLGGHSEAINLEFEKEFTLEQAFDILRNTQGVVLQDNIKPINGEANPAIGAKPDVVDGKITDATLGTLPYPMPLYAKGRDEVFVGRVRLDPSVDNGLNLWCVTDNLRKGAATNAVQIAEVLLKFF